MVVNLDPVRRIRGRFRVRRIRWRFDEFAMTNSVAGPAALARPGRFLVTELQTTTDNNQQSSSMEAESSQASAQNDLDTEFVWNQSIMSSQTYIKIGDAKYYH